jgi:putative DNA primase/helicase
LFAFITRCLRAGVAVDAIVDACLDPAHDGHAVHNHCTEKGGNGYVERQVAKARETVRDAGSETTTDLGNARRLVRLYGNELRYVPPWRSWLTWKDSQWQRDDDGAVMRLAKATIEEIFIEAARINDENRRAAIRSHALKSLSAQRLAAMVKLAESEIEVVAAVNKIDADPYLLGVRNGVIDLRKGKVVFREGRREDYVTKTAGVAFDEQAECPNWLAFLKRIFQSEKLIAYLQRTCGYLLTGLTVEEVMVVMWGRGSNGKTTFRETLFALMGDYAIGSDASLLITDRKGGATPDLARLFGRRMVTINETEQHSHLNEARVKFITGHDVITARNLYEALFDFTPTHKTFLTTNYKPIIRGTDDGIWRRIHSGPSLPSLARRSATFTFARTS